MICGAEGGCAVGDDRNFVGTTLTPPGCTFAAAYAGADGSGPDLRTLGKPPRQTHAGWAYEAEVSEDRLSGPYDIKIASADPERAVKVGSNGKAVD